MYVEMLLREKYSAELLSMKVSVAYLKNNYIIFDIFPEYFIVDQDCNLKRYSWV